MSSSGLIYAVIVGAWAAYLVPMWLRRQDELNESRPTERFSTAIRLLAGRSALERRAARTLDDRTGEHDTTSASDASAETAEEASVEPEAEGAVEPSPVSAPAPVSVPGPAPASAPAPEPVRPAAERREAPHHQPSERRARLLARRRRMVTFLFLAFAAGAVVAAVAGVAFIWAPTVPAVLLTLYIGHLRRLERQRYEVKVDRARAAQAAERLHARERDRASDRPAPHDAAHPADPGRPHLRLAADPGGHGRSSEAGAPAAPGASAASAATVLAETTEHEEWVDGMRERAAAGRDSWEPVPVPLPTYVTAPVAPRTTRNLDLGAPNTWDSGRPAPEARKTPLFDQYADPTPPAATEQFRTRPRAANE